MSVQQPQRSDFWMLAPTLINAHLEDHLHLLDDLTTKLASVQENLLC